MKQEPSEYKTSKIIWTGRGLIIGAILSLVGFIVCFLALNIDFGGAILSFYKSFASIFIGTGFASTPVTLISLALILTFVLGLILLIYSCFKKNNPVIRKYTITLSICFIVIYLLSIATLGQRLDLFQAKYVASLGGTAYGDGWVSIFISCLGTIFFLTLSYVLTGFATIFLLMENGHYEKAVIKEKQIIVEKANQDYKRLYLLEVLNNELSSPASIPEEKKKEVKPTKETSNKTYKSQPAFVQFISHDPMAPSDRDEALEELGVSIIDKTTSSSSIVSVVNRDSYKDHSSH